MRNVEAVAMDDRHHEVLVVAALFFVLSWVAVGLRVYVRGFMMKTWGKDDSYMVATLLFFTVYLAFQIVAAVHGTGRHRWNLSDEDARIALMFWYLCELLYVLSNCLLKFAIGYFYLRVAQQRWHIWSIRLLMAGTILFGIAYFFLVMLQCLPISEFWNTHPASSKCFNRPVTLGITYSLGIVNALADWAFGILPFFIVWDMEMHLRTKLLIAGILAFAAIGSTGTIVRMFYLKTLMEGPDFLYATTDVAVWSTIEPGIGIVAGSIATLRPLVRRILWRVGLAEPPREHRSRTYFHTSNERQRKSRRGFRRSLSPSALMPTELTGTTITNNSNFKRIENWEDMELPPMLHSTPQSIVGGYEEQARQSIRVQDEIESPPRLHFRDSFRNSMNMGSVLDVGRANPG